eukprot:7226162-Prymnesium_polylepis.1
MSSGNARDSRGRACMIDEAVVMEGQLRAVPSRFGLPPWFGVSRCGSYVESLRVTSWYMLLAAYPIVLCGSRVPPAAAGVRGPRWPRLAASLGGPPSDVFTNALTLSRHSAQNVRR